MKTCENGICISPPTVSCIPPLLWHTNRCECQDGSMPIGFADGMAICAAPPAVVAPQCVVTISYRDPGTPELTSSGCDAAGVELALAVLLAKLLGAR